MSSDPKAEREARKVARAEARAAADADRVELLAVLEDRFEEEIGPMGEAWQILNFPETPVVVKMGAGVLYTRFSALVDKKGAASLQDLQEFVCPCVAFPDLEAYKALSMRRTGIPDDCAAALVLLYKGRVIRNEGK